MSPDTAPCWIVLRRAAGLRAYGDALAAAGRPTVLFDAPEQALARLQAAGSVAPGLLVCSLVFDDGDTLPLIRALGARRPGALLWVASRQQRAVIQAASQLARSAGLEVLGAAEFPAGQGALVEALARWSARPVLPPQPSRAPRPRSLAELQTLLRDGGIRAWMQPQLRLRTREIIGFEALMRGVDDSGGIVGPDELLPGLVAHGLLEDATLAVLRQTVDMVADAMSVGLAISGSVNVSLRSLSDRAFCRQLPRVLDARGLDPSWITLEITETDAMADPGDVVENTARIRMMGFNLAIDDFGTAYSSLSQLLTIPFSELKLDRSFVRHVDTDPRLRAVVQACATLGRELGLQVVAEGVETAGELDSVLSCGCTHVQGYHVARAMPPETLLPWLSRLPDLVWRQAA